MGAPGASLPRQGSAVVPSWLRKHLLSLLDLMEEAHPDCLFDCTPESTSSQSYSGENIETAASPMSRFSSRSTTAQGRVSRCPRPPNIPSPGPPPFSALPPPPSGPGSVQGTALCSLSSRDASRSH